MQAMVDTRVITHGGKNVFSVPLYQNLVQDRTVLNRNPSSYSIRYNMDECARLFKDIMMAKGFDADVISNRLQTALAIEAKHNDEAKNKLKNVHSRKRKILTRCVPLLEESTLQDIYLLMKVVLNKLLEAYPIMLPALKSIVPH